MRSSTYGKMFIALAILALIIAAMFRFFRPVQSSPVPSQSVEVQSGSIEQPNISVARIPRIHPNHPAPSAPDNTSDADPFTISHEKIEAYLKQHNRDAASLLAAFHVGADTNLLNEAAARYPDDPRVQLAMLMHSPDDSPEDKRKWLDAFKVSSPSNSLAFYLSARAHFENGDPNAAIQELSDAAVRDEFTDYSKDSSVNIQQLELFSGKSQTDVDEAGLEGMLSDSAAEFDDLKQLALRISEAQKQYSNGGDAASAQTLAQMEIAMSQRLVNSDVGKTLAAQLVGGAIESIALGSLDLNTSYDFLGGETPAQVLAEIKTRKDSYKEVITAFETIWPIMTDDQRADYIERRKNGGQFAAMRWAQRHYSTPAVDSQ